MTPVAHKTHLIEWRLCAADGLLSGIIEAYGRRVGAGHYSHVDVLDPVGFTDPVTGVRVPPGWLWGARSDTVPAPDGRPIPPGFRARPPGYATWRQCTAFRLRVTPLQHRRFWEFTYRQRGKPYDTAGLIDTYALGRDWRDPSGWWCSEEQAAAAEYAWITGKLWEGVNRVTPGGWAFLLTALGAEHEDLLMAA